MRRISLNLLIIISLVCAALVSPQSSVRADSSVTTGDMIDLMNGYRTGSYGLPALVESATLDSCAQWTAETMADIQATTHLVYLGYDGASTRCAGFGFGGGKTIFVTENWAMHTTMTINILASYWSDAAHMLPATDPQYTYVGAGIASANGETYYVLQAGSIAGEVAPTQSNTLGPGTQAPTTDTSQYMNPVTTSTPSEDGYIYHIVKYGQTLFDIALAYGITLAYLKEENNLTSNNIYEGQKLVIKQAPTPTVTPTFTVTPIYPTRTPSSNKATKTPRPALTVTSTVTPTPAAAPILPPLDRETLGLALVILSALGLAVAIFFMFFKPAKPGPAQAVQNPSGKNHPETVLPAAEEPAKKKRTPKPASQQAKAASPVESKLPAPAPVKKKRAAKPASQNSAGDPLPEAQAPVKKPRTPKKKTQE